MWVRATRLSRLTYIGVYYRPPNTNFGLFFDEFETSLSEYTALSDCVVCTGDFNINLLDLSDSMVVKVLDLFNTLGVVQLVDMPTRITATSSTLLDWLILGGQVTVQKSGTFGTTFSDHMGVLCNIDLKIQKSPKRSFHTRIFRHFNYDEFVNDLPKDHFTREFLGILTMTNL
ncbi:hypothetical protein QE152_g27382 [Popillia japonica]|uniref:Endonuclease/exonuclease/phosphatase domain-containing protein n=1 Tax=Popillia japonica TaxID=7064 RepID=A0AAW1JV99_POPJA